MTQVQKISASLALVAAQLAFPFGAAQAVPIKDCPQAILIDLDDIQQWKNAKIREALEEGDYVYSRNQGIVQSHALLEGGRERVTAELKLKEAVRATCRYDGDDLYAVISGSLNKGAAKPAVLSLFWSRNEEQKFAAYVRVESLSPLRVHSSKSVAIYYPGVTCNNADCGPKSFRIGFANRVTIR